MRIFKASLKAAREAQVGDCIRNPIPHLMRTGGPFASDKARIRATHMDEILKSRGLRVDNTAMSIGYVEEDK